MVSPAGLRFDFSHFQKVTNEQLREVEQMVNAAIRANDPLDERRECPIDEAREAGAMMLFGEKYGDKVRMVRFGESVELCGGTHTSATGNIGMFKILSESAISAGVRRIEAVTGVGAEKVLYAAEDTIRQIEEFFHNSKIVPAIKRLIENNEALSQEVEQMRREQIAAMAEQLAKACPEVDGMQLIARTFERSTEFVKDLAYNLRAKMPRLVLVAGSVAGGKATLTIMLGDEIVAAGANASQVVRTAAKEINGGGGGQPFFATAGGKNPEGMQKAIDVAVELIKQELNK